MAASVAAGSRLLVHMAGGGTAVLRSLRAVSLSDGWCIPVLADAAALAAPATAVDLPTDDGMVRVDVELVRLDGALALHAPGLADAVLVQRRSDLRGALRLRVRGALLSAGPVRRARGGAETVAATPSDLPAAVEGTTLSVSAGGVALCVDGPGGTLPAGARLYAEFELPGGELVPAVLAVVEHAEGDAGSSFLRGRFLDISPRDRERLVKLVFARHREELAARRRGADAATDGR